MFREEIEALSQELFEIYKDLHRHPEIGYNEIRTSKIVADFLKDCGMEVTTGVAITGVVGVLDSGKPGKTLMLRADMDCLQVKELAECEYRSENEGLMHACGHDAHVTMLLGAAKILSMHKDTFSGRIKFVFQPSEEGIPNSMVETVRKAGYNGNGGAEFMVQEGVLNDVDACVVMHVQPSLPLGTVSIAKKNACASSDVFCITLVGRGGHGAQPQNAIDPVPAAAELISAIHMLPTREVSAVETCVLSIGSVETPGSVWNVVAEKVCITGGFRTFNEEVRDHLKLRIKELSQNIAQANRCTLVYEKVDGYMPCINDENIANLLAESCREVLGDKNVILTDIPVMTSEDCGIYFSHVPGALFWLGISEKEGAPPLHSPYFHFGDKALTVGITVHVNNAITLLNILNIL